MKLQIFKLLCLVQFLIGGISCHAQESTLFREKEKLLKEYDSKGLWKKSVQICNEIIALNSESDDLSNSQNRLKSTAYFCLGHYYLHAHFFSFNLQEAINNFQKSACVGYSYVGIPELYLSSIYNQSCYGVNDFEKSLYWIKRGSEKYGVLQYMLGEIFEFGYTYNIQCKGAMNTYVWNSEKLNFPNVVLDKAEAYKHYLNYYEWNSSYITDKIKITEYEIGVAFMDGTYFKKDYDKAYEYLNRCLPSLSEIKEDISFYSTEEDADVLYRLSILIRFGLGVSCNEYKANQYLKCAAVCGSKKAKETLSSINFEDLDY